MEAKKSKEANLEDKKIVFMVLGLVMISAVILMAFTSVTAEIDDYVAQDDEKVVFNEDALEQFEVEAPEPEQQEVVAPPPPTPEEVIIEEDDVEIEETDFSALGEEQDFVEETGNGDDMEIKEEPIADFAEIEPAFPGGELAMANFIRDNIVYPELSREMGEQGTVYVQFVVNQDGSIQDVVVVKKVSDLLDKEAIRVVKMMPKWSAGEQAGKKVRVRFTLPINFRIQ